MCLISRRLEQLKWMQTPWYSDPNLSLEDGRLDMVHWLGCCCHIVSFCICLVFYPSWLMAGTGRHYRARWTHSRLFMSLILPVLSVIGGSLGFCSGCSYAEGPNPLFSDNANTCKEEEERQDLCSVHMDPVLKLV